jgi:hypothetical protein
MGNPVYFRNTNPNNQENNKAEKKEGTEIPNVEKAIIRLSKAVFLRAAAQTPKGIPIMRATNIAANVNRMVPINASPSSSFTGLLV